MADLGARSTAEIRPATADDIPQILALSVVAGWPATTGESMALAIEDVDRLILVAIAGGTVVGWAKTHYWDQPDGQTPAGHYLGGITVAPIWRRRGVGTGLTQARLDWIWARDNFAWYVVNAGNGPSIRLHQQWGFVEMAQGSQFHGTTFTGGRGLLMRAGSKRITAGGAEE
ncbi:GNAT family N-acetyltransferase [Arthrobacter sp. TWP1-1]|uniref:GNAT family N-acetyltransferase n=1 Tax=Arthrobacter sp. TWP1-1 TaxID=2804568 RepID=UPI003CED5B5B